MPTVPQYELGQVQSSGVNGMQNINAPADAFGANVARAQQGMGQEISRQAEIMFQREQKVQQAYEKGVLRELDNNLSSYIREKLIHPEAGFMTLTGRNAMSAKGALVENINEYRKSLEKDLNPRMLNNWSTMADSRVNSANNTISDHVMRETINYNKTESASRLAGLAEDVKLAGLSTDDEGNNPEAQKYVGSGVIEINSQLMDEFGIDVNSPRDEGELEIIANAHLKFTTLAHESVIDSLIADQRPSVAKRYFEKNQGEIDQATQDKIKKVLDTETQRAEAQRVTDEIRQNPELDIKAQLEIAREIKDSALRDAVVERLKTRDAEDDAIATENQNIAYDAAQKLLTDHPQATSRTVIPADVFKSMSGAQRLQIDNVLNARKKALLDANEKHLVKVEKRNKEIKEIEDQIRFNYLYDLAKNNPKEFQKIGLNLYIGFMSEANLKTLKDLREGNQNLDLLGTVDEMINSTLSGLGWDITKALEQGRDGDTIRAFTNELRLQMGRHEQENGKGSANDQVVWKLLADMAADSKWHNTGITNEVKFRGPTDSAFTMFASQSGLDIEDLNTITKDGGILTDFRIRVNQMEAEHYAEHFENPTDVAYQKMLSTAYYEMIANGTIEGRPTIPIEVKFRAKNNDMLAGVVAQLGLSMSDYDKQTPQGEKVRRFVGWVNNAETAFWVEEGNYKNVNDIEYKRILTEQGLVFASQFGVEMQPNMASFTPDHKVINNQAFVDTGLDIKWLKLGPVGGGERARNFNNRLNSELEEFYHENKRNPYTPEWQDIVNDIVGDQVYINGYGIDDLISVATATNEWLPDAYVKVDGEKVFIDKISKVDRSRIKTTLQNNDMRDWAQDIAKLSLIPEDELAELIEAYYLKTGRKQQLSADLLYTSQKSFESQKTAEEIRVDNITYDESNDPVVEDNSVFQRIGTDGSGVMSNFDADGNFIGDKKSTTPSAIDDIDSEQSNLSKPIEPSKDIEKTYEQKQKEQDQKTLKYAKQNRKLKLTQSTGGKSQYTAYPVVQSNTRKILSFIKGDGENPKAELDQINEYLANTSGDHPWDVLFNEADTNISERLLADLKKSQVKKLTKRKEAILKDHPEWKDKVKKDLVDAADNKILTDISGMKTKAQVNALKSHTDNILKQINWQAKAPKNITPSQEVKLMREELKLIKQYFAAANDEETHPWDEIFSSTYEFLSTSNSTSDADNEANEMIIELADEYLDMQFDILTDRKKELQKALQ